MAWYDELGSHNNGKNDVSDDDDDDDDDDDTELGSACVRGRHAILRYILSYRVARVGSY